MFEKLVRWHPKMKKLALFGTLAGQGEKSAQLWHVILGRWGCVGDYFGWVGWMGLYGALFLVGEAFFSMGGVKKTFLVGEVGSGVTRGGCID